MTDKELREKRRKEADERSDRRKRETWNKHINRLPDSASAAAEITWIRNHPAMSRLDRMEPGERPNRIILDWRDISKAPHGPAPSKAAAYMLQHWCNRPQDFYKMILSGQHKNLKAGNDSGDEEENTPPEVQDIDKLLGTLDSAVSEDS